MYDRLVQPPHGRKSGDSDADGAAKGSQSDPDETEGDSSPSGLGAVVQTARRVGSDLAGITDLMRAVPEISEHLAAIRSTVASMDSEIRGMRKSVDELATRIDSLHVGVEGKLGELDDKVGPMSQDVRLMRVGVEQLDTRVVELARTLKPVRRTIERLGFGRSGRAELADELPAGGEEES